MIGVGHPDDSLRDLTVLSAEELTTTLAAYFTSIGGLATDSEREIGRELIRRARRLEKLQQGQQGEKGPPRAA